MSMTSSLWGSIPRRRIFQNDGRSGPVPERCVKNRHWQYRPNQRP